MRIYNYDIDKSFKEIFIYLTPNEIEELISKLNWLLENPKDHHEHLIELGENDEISREITVAIYTNDNINEFDERSKKLILEGK